MIKKLIILGLLIWALVFFYNKFMADTMGGFFKGNKDNVDFFKTSSPTTDKLQDLEKY